MTVDLPLNQGDCLGNVGRLFVQTKYPYQLGSDVCGWTNYFFDLKEANPTFYSASSLFKEGAEFMTVPHLIGDINDVVRASLSFRDDRVPMPNKIANLSIGMLNATQHTFEVVTWLAERSLYTVSQEVFDTFSSIASGAKAASATIGMIENITHLATSSLGVGMTDAEISIEGKAKASSWCNLVANITNIALGVLGVLGIMIGLVVAAPITLVLSTIATVTAIAAFFFTKQRDDLVQEHSIKQLANPV